MPVYVDIFNRSEHPTCFARPRASYTNYRTARGHFGRKENFAGDDKGSRDYVYSEKERRKLSELCRFSEEVHDHDGVTVEKMIATCARYSADSVAMKIGLSALSSAGHHSCGGATCVSWLELFGSAAARLRMSILRSIGENSRPPDPPFRGWSSGTARSNDVLRHFRCRQFLEFKILAADSTFLFPTAVFLLAHQPHAHRLQHRRTHKKCQCFGAAILHVAAELVGTVDQCAPSAPTIMTTGSSRRSIVILSPRRLVEFICGKVLLQPGIDRD